MYCSKCGNQAQQTDLWCTRCGSRLEERVTEPNQTQKVENAPMAESRSEKRIKDYFGRSIVSALFGSISLGAAAVIFSGMTRTELAVGDISRAGAYSEKAKAFCAMSFAVGIVKVLCVAAILLSTVTLSIIQNFF